ncbi:hypothetical protein [Dechloromonas sp. H13]|uniref:hypothetical protein n=1 Tax=Dechloromonas sp. H13 TaxID=2570193 RepID=UPI001292B3E0|nr:hypothetical protein [Dechloromonas sp. H13]
MMQRIQSIFNRLAGFANFEAERLARAHSIFIDADRRFGELETPAYLRRKPRVTSIRR